MGAWGPKLYQDDMAQEIRDIYKDKLHRGKTGEEITRMLVDDFRDVLTDPDDAPIFWFALADTQWNLGRLEEQVKAMALFYIRSGSDLRRWEIEDAKEAKKREKVLKELEQKLLTPQPEEKKVSQYKLYQCEWAEGDVYAYPLTSEYAKEKGIGGQYFLFHKIGETIYWPGHTIPVVRVKITKDKALPRTSREFDELQYVQTFRKKYEANGLPLRGECQVNGKKAEPSAMGNLEFFPEYRLILINTSKRIIPKDLVYIGNFKDIAPPPIEYIPEDISISGFLWKFFDKCMIDRYYDLR